MTSRDPLSKLSAPDRELLFSARWLASRIIDLSRGQGCPPTITNFATDLRDNLTEVLDVDLPSHADGDRLPDLDTKPTIDEEALDGALSDDFSDRTVGKLFVAIGHNDGTGARSHDGLDEWRTSKMTAEAMLALGPAYGLEVLIAVRNRRKSYGDAMRLHGINADRWGADLAFEIHRNAYNGKARGAEFIHVSKAGKTAARFLAAVTRSHYGDGVILRRDDGALDRSKGGNGAGFCRAPKCPGIVVEPCFFDCVADWPRIRDHVDREARTYLAAAKAAIVYGFEAKTPTLTEATAELARVFPEGSLRV